MINVTQPSVGAEELAAISAVFDSKWLGSGRRTEEFEEQFAQHLGVSAESLLFLNSATSGLFLAAELLGIGPGDEVVLPSNGFIANANCVIDAGARPVFCDIDDGVLNPRAEDVVKVLTPRTKAVMVLHYGGYPGEVEKIAALCAERGVALIEDAAVSVASSAGGRMCGTFGDFGIWSFDARKVITTGDGGMLYVRDPEVARRARRLAYHGLEDRSSFTTAAKSPHLWWSFDIEDIGRRLVGNDMTAAMGKVQLRRLPEFVGRRRAIAERYTRALSGVPGVRVPPPLPEGHLSTHYFYWVRFDTQAVRDGVSEDLLAKDIYTSWRYYPLHRVPRYGATDAVLPVTDRVSDTALLLPAHQDLLDEEVDLVAREVVEAVQARGAIRG
ncbi:DegT/DnrJ/EryC1/StrS family aminotransferase [Streptomyces olivaceus]|uniref:DegT/DnrJ/EryC1/StrS family aminotransferase n=1 Tax=Streptomyces olivaceus TaxID=47716 RepID=UPI001CC9AA79|nr:DegT/DnrJ/EryC1/StrS family aminotransferase [Streptomyces olivaceus]MBZ6232735.1 DegT/DnrJ/EryC1/StrS family aminotransferase [Streptomyces olivaceus]